MVAGESVTCLAYGESFDPFGMPCLRATSAGGEFELNGVKRTVRHGDVASHFLLGVELGGQPALFVVERDAPGLQRRAMRLIDGAGAVDLELCGVRVPAEARLQIVDVDESVRDALEWGLVGLAVETAELIDTSNRSIFEYLAVREQFGTKLVKFQALQHIAANLAIAGAEAAAMATRAVDALADAPSHGRSIVILRASLACDAAGRRAAHDGVQLFGGMGLSDSTPISHFARRLAAIRTQIGTGDLRAGRLAGLEGHC